MFRKLKYLYFKSCVYFRVREQIKRKAQDTLEQPRALIKEATSSITYECAVKLPYPKSLSRAIQRERETGIPNPKTIKEMSIPIELQRTIRGDTFLAYDSGPDDVERMLLFTTEDNLDILETNTTWHADGTFKVCPALFYQMYTIHAVMNCHTVSLIYMLLQKKTEATYVRPFSQIKEINPLLEPQLIYMDFERASINAFQQCFPSATLKGYINSH